MNPMLGIPMPKLPDFSIMPSLLGDAIGIAIVSFVLTVSVGKLMAKKHGYRIDCAQEPYAYGTFSLFPSLARIIPPAQE
jgi:MFS superfamily sulfate permease-like transporter